MTHHTDGHEQVTKEIDALKKDLEHIRRDLKSTLRSTGDYGKERLLDSREHLYSAMKGLQSDLQETLHSTYDSAKERGHEMAEMSREKIGKKPLMTVLTAFAAGAVLGLFLKWKE